MIEVPKGTLIKICLCLLKMYFQSLVEVQLQLVELNPNANTGDEVDIIGMGAEKLVDNNGIEMFRKF